MDSAGPEILAVHIPKTAGSAFDAVLKSVYGEEQVERDDGPTRTDRSLYPDPDALRAHVRAAVEERTSWPRVITGHFPLSKYERFRRSAFTIVWLREPAARLLSQYFFYRSPAPTPGMTAWARAARAIPPERIMEVDWPSNPITERLLRGYDADDIDFVGIQEHFAEDLADLGRMLGWPPVEIPVHNRLTTAEYLEFHPSAELLQKIRAANEADVQLYKRALQLRRDRIARRAPPGRKTIRS